MDKQLGWVEGNSKKYHPFHPKKNWRKVNAYKK
jgi:hypothetical protein